MRGLVRRKRHQASLQVGPEKKKDSARTSSASDAPGSEQQDTTSTTTSTTEGKTEEEYIHAVTYQTAWAFSFAKGSPLKPALAGVYPDAAAGELLFFFRAGGGVSVMKTRGACDG